MQATQGINIVSDNAMTAALSADGWLGADETSIVPQVDELPSGVRCAKAPNVSEGDKLSRQIVQVCLIMATAGLVLLGIAIAGFFWHKQALPAPAGSAQSVPGSVGAQSSPIPLVIQAVSSPAVIPVATPTGSVSAPSAARVLSQSEALALIAELKNGVRPTDCAAANQMLVAGRNIVTRQAQQIARRAFPELCVPVVASSAVAATPAATPAASRQTVMSPVVVKPVKNIDALYQERIRAECATSGFDHMCSSKIRERLCEGAFSSDPPLGQLICKQ